MTLSVSSGVRMDLLRDVFVRAAGPAVAYQNLIQVDSLVVSNRRGIACVHGDAPKAMPQRRTALVLELIALRHQIAVLERNRTRRPCFHRSDRLLWILLSYWWLGWRDSLAQKHHLSAGTIEDCVI